VFDAFRLQSVREAFRNGIVRPDDDKVDTFFAREPAQAVKVHHVDRHATGNLRNACVSGCTKKGRRQRRCGYGPAQGVLASTGTNHQNFHDFLPISVSPKAIAACNMHAW
jgi:hypothetical protein